MHVIIIGGGVAGPAAALALFKLCSPQFNVRVTIIEAFAESFELGTYFTVQDNGMHCLKELGVLPQVEEIAFATSDSIMYGSGLKPIARMPFGGSMTMKRGRLSRVLIQEALRQGCEVIYGKRFVNATSSAAGVTVALEDGQTLECDLLIGADGVHSKVRQLINPLAAPAHYIGLINHAGECPVPASMQDSIVPGTWHFCFCRRTFILYHLSKSNTVVWGINEPRAEMFTREERRDKTSADWKQHCLSLFDDDEQLVKQLIENTETLDLAGDPQCFMATVAQWRDQPHGRMVLLGDAIHAPPPTSGQGASMAL